MQAVLMICDPSESKFTLLERAQKMAALNNAKLHILDLVYIRGLKDLEPLTNEQREAACNKAMNARKRELRAILTKHGINPKQSIIHIRWGKNLVEATLELCKEINPVLVVKRAVAKNKQVFHTPTDWHLIEKCPSPLLISPLRAYKKKSRILVALDLATKVKSKAALNHELIKTAKHHADALGAELHVVCCMSISKLVADLDLIDIPAYQKKTRRKVKPLLDEFQAKYGVKDECIHFKVGQASNVITTTAKKLRADMIVLGAIGRRGIKGRLLGSTAEQLLNHLHTDLLLIRP